MADEEEKKNKDAAEETLALDSKKQKEFEERVKRIEPRVSCLSETNTNLVCYCFVRTSKPYLMIEI